MTVTRAWSGHYPDAGVTGGRPTYVEFDRSTTLTFLHEPANWPTDIEMAVLLCPPFGWEEVCSARALRTVAAALARAGYPTARLTLPGTADGSGGPREPDLLDAWIDAVGGAAEWLRQRTAASRCVAFGIGLGGMLAYVAASKHDAIDDLVLWAVRNEGRALLHESRSLSKVIASDFPEDQGDPAALDDLELIGYLMSSDTQTALSELQLSAHVLPDCDRRRVLLLSRGAQRVDQALRDSLERPGAEVEVRRTNDYYGLMVRPEQSQPPADTIAHLLDWLAQGSAIQMSRPALQRGTQATNREVPEMELSDGVIETPFGCSGTRGNVFGIVSRNPAAGQATLALVFVGAGALPHTGPNRAWVEIARRWAGRGIPTVRVDLAGIGEAGGEDPELVSDESTYESWRVDDVRAVLDQLQGSGVADRFVLGGLCSGANSALQGALADPRVCGLLLINLFLVTWSSELIAERRRRGPLADRSRNGGVGRLASYAERRQMADAVAAFDELKERDTEVLLLFGTQEALYEELVCHRLVDQPGRWPNIRLERIPSRDQMFRAQWLQRHVHTHLDDAVMRMLAKLPGGAGRNQIMDEVDT
jgi:alpha-beta hydrolase superfamily lysophospholipase